MLSGQQGRRRRRTGAADTAAKGGVATASDMRVVPDPGQSGTDNVLLGSQWDVGKEVQRRHFACRPQEGMILATITTHDSVGECDVAVAVVVGAATCRRIHVVAVARKRTRLQLRRCGRCACRQSFIRNPKPTSARRWLDYDWQRGDSGQDRIGIGIGTGMASSGRIRGR